MGKTGKFAGKADTLFDLLEALGLEGPTTSDQYRMLEQRTFWVRADQTEGGRIGERRRRDTAGQACIVLV